VAALSPVRSADEAVWLTVDDPAVAGTARRLAAEMAGRVGFDEKRAREVGLAATEAVANLDIHAGGGHLVLRRTRQADQAGIEMVAIDGGPGMSDAAGAAADGFSTAGTLGLGIGMIERLSTECETWSALGQGTVVVASFWPGPAPPAAWPAAGITRAMADQEECGDEWAVRPVEAGIQLLLADGLGHGAMASLAAREAVRLFLEAPAEGPAGVMEHLHAGLHHTRGAAAAVVELCPAEARVSAAGIGNVRATIDSGDRRKDMVTNPGIVGHQARSIAAFDYELTKEAVVVMHSDGVSNRWDLSSYPGLRRRHPLAAAAVLMRDAGTRRDDAAVVLARGMA